MPMMRVTLTVCAGVLVIKAAVQLPFLLLALVFAGDCFFVLPNIK